MPLSLLMTSGSLEYLERKTTLQVRRGEKQRIEELIEELINSGYRHDESLSETWTYRRE